MIDLVLVHRRNGARLLRVLNRGESVNSLKRSIYVGRVAGYQAKHAEQLLPSLAATKSRATGV